MRNGTLVLPLVLLGYSTAAAGDYSGWIFQPGNFSHHPATRQRVDQFAQLPMIDALPDGRRFASGLRRSRVTLRGADGTVTEYQRVDNWGNGRGGIDAQWERVNDVWRRSTLSGGYGYGGYRSGYAPYGYRGRYAPGPETLPYGDGAAPGNGP